LGFSQGRQKIEFFSKVSEPEGGKKIEILAPEISIFDENFGV